MLIALLEFETTKILAMIKTNVSFSPCQVLDGLLEEDEEVVETWYLLGWVNKLRATFESKAETGKEVRWSPFLLINFLLN